MGGSSVAMGVADRWKGSKAGGVSLPSRDQQRTRKEGKPAGARLRHAPFKGSNGAPPIRSRAESWSCANAQYSTDVRSTWGGVACESCERSVGVVSQHRSYGVDRMPPCVVMSVKSPLLGWPFAVVGKGL
jgi:hypothetical protein